MLLRGKMWKALDKIYNGFLHKEVKGFYMY